MFNHHPRNRKLDGAVPIPSLVGHLFILSPSYFLEIVMANYRSIHVRTWKDPDFVELSMEGKLIFLYLLLNEEVTTSGIYPISPITISNETGIPLPTVGDTLGKGLPNVGYDQKTKTVFIKNHLKYDKGGSLENCIIAIANDCKFIKSPFWADFVNLYPTHAKGLPNPLPYSTPTPTPTSLGIDESKKQDSSLAQEKTSSPSEAPKRKAKTWRDYTEEELAKKTRTFRCVILWERCYFEKLGIESLARQQAMAMFKTRLDAGWELEDWIPRYFATKDKFVQKFGLESFDSWVKRQKTLEMKNE